MRNVGLLFAIATAILTIFVSPPTRAAEFRIVSRSGPATEKYLGSPTLNGRNALSPCHIQLEGEIVKGDLERLRQVLARVREENGQRIPRHVGLCLNSRGGSYMEAIRIAKAMLGKRQTDDPKDYEPIPLRTWTIVARNDECYSACAVIFMAGNIYVDDEMMGPTYSRHLHVKGKLGFHSPYLAFPLTKSVNYSGESVKLAFRQGALAVRELTKLGENLNRGGQVSDTNLFPQALINEMLARSEGDLYFIDRVGKAVVYNIDLFGANRPRRVGPCEYDNICWNRHHRHLFSTSDEKSTPLPQVCSKFWKTIRRKYLYSGDSRFGGTGGYGGEGLYHCVLKKTGRGAANLEYYNELIEDRKKKLDKWGFSKAPWFYYYSPETPFNSLK